MAHLPIPKVKAEKIGSVCAYLPGSNVVARLRPYSYLYVLNLLTDVVSVDFESTTQRFRRPGSRNFKLPLCIEFLIPAT